MRHNDRSPHCTKLDLVHVVFILFTKYEIIKMNIIYSGIYHLIELVLEWQKRQRMIFCGDEDI